MRLADAEGEVVGIEEGFAAGIVSEGEEGFLGVGVFVAFLALGLAGEDAGTAWGGDGGVTGGGGGDEAPGVYGVEAETGADSGIGGGGELGLVFEAGFGDSAGKIDDGLFLRDFGEFLGEVFEGGEFAVGIEDGEFGFIELEGVVVGVDVGGVGIDGIDGTEGLDGSQKSVAIVGEIENLLEFIREDVNGDGVDGGELRREKLGSRFLGADLVRGGHGGEVKEEDEEATVFKRRARGRRFVARDERSGRRDRDGGEGAGD